MIRDFYLAWLDEPLPVLRGKTPRQMCRTKKGRQKVATLIRGMPKPMFDDEVDVPREEMLRELGLGG